MNFPDITEKVKMIIKKANIEKDKKMYEDYKSCKRLESVMKKIINNPDIVNTPTSIYDIEHPYLQYLNFNTHNKYSLECYDVLDLIKNVNNNHPNIYFNVNKNYVDTITMIERNNKLIYSFY